MEGGYPLVEFDGAMLSKYDKDGNLFVEYIGDWGNYQDVPIKKIQEIFKEKYRTIFTELEFQRTPKK